jgi:uncharacterized protein (DUF58 family)
MDINTENLEREVENVLANVVKNQIHIPWRSHVRSFGFGDRRSTRRGTGNDFDTFRDMQPGDDPKLMSARLLASTKKRMVRVDRPETQIYAYVMVDIRRSMHFGSKRVTKLQLAAELAASCIVSLDKTKDRCGFMLFSDSGLEELMTPRIANYTQAYLAVTSIFSTLPKPRAVDEKPRSGLAESLVMAISKRSLIFVISDFIGYTDEDWKALEEAAGLHDIICLHVEDEREQKLPERKYSRWFGWLQRRFPTLYAIEDWSGQTRYIWDTEANRAQYAANYRQFKSELQARFQEHNCRWLVVNTKEGEAAFPSLIQAFGGAR